MYPAGRCLQGVLDAGGHFIFMMRVGALQVCYKLKKLCNQNCPFGNPARPA
jgi:hypothetical protein